MKTLRKRMQMADGLNGAERSLIGIITQLNSIKTTIENMKIEVDADADFPQSDKDFMLQAYNLVNNSNYTDFVTFIQNALL